jgi:hypothetical protein
MSRKHFKKGDKVFWHDPDEDISSGEYKVTNVFNEEVILIDNGYSEAEVPPWELTLLEKGK